MNQNNFDEQVRKAVENISSDYQPNSWDLLEQRLDEALPPQADSSVNNSAEDEFDNIIRQKIGNKTPQYRPNHWVIMSSLLDEHQSIGAWLRRNRVLEIGLTALFLFTFVNVFYIPNQLNNGFLVKNEKNTTKENINQPFIAKQEAPLNSNLDNSEKSSGVFNFLKANFSDKSFGSSQQIKSPIQIFSEKNNIAVKNKLEINNQVIISNKEAFTPVFPKKEKTIALENLPILSLKNIETDKNTLAFIQKTTKKTKKWQTYFGIFAMANINQVKTPDAYFFGSYIPEFLQYRYGQGLGFTLGANRGRYSFETGLFFDKKIYAPADVRLEKSSNISANAHLEKLEDIKINSVQIPIQFSFDVVKRKRWSAFALLGATTHIIMQAKYDKSRSFVGYAFRPIPTIEPELEIAKPKYDDGLLAARTFSGNTYGSVNAGLGATYKITPRWSMLGQAKYQYFLPLDGIGPNSDKINTYSFWLGLRKAF